MNPLRLDADTVINLDLVVALQRTAHSVVDVFFAIPYPSATNPQRLRVSYSDSAAATLLAWMERNAPHRADSDTRSLVG